MITHLAPRFIDTIPEHPESGVLYVSIEYATTLHLCACGCGYEVVLGIAPRDWKITWDGETVTINPSVGNWSLPCQSHYLIRRNKIVWARRWTNKEIDRGRAADALRKRLQQTRTPLSGDALSPRTPP
ncbi:hypothetical protein Psed_4334 [Pseudonocardia dioxanivorans CB1190]|uniref:Uncharacterized protein n=1 Tax=Pseudonocardia dioxanivorans (strain ATCC 55486 / DSM 44775 / JCM 13855 / CB1190) TaxID=675635 RepID=F4CXC0_PSEUX|nr:DUF6527 family protein [Pseudonocardia dioxanivorans]AEA26494.1 hypothetical protein Psed_4334 [Pseudonocardia dioxanivorans CB1190]